MPLHARSVNLHIPAGTTLALVGESGSGKSSIVQLACRFYDPSEGAVRSPYNPHASRAGYCWGTILRAVFVESFRYVNVRHIAANVSLQACLTHMPAAE